MNATDLIDAAFGPIMMNDLEKFKAVVGDTRLDDDVIEALLIGAREFESKSIIDYLNGIKDSRN